jgi:ribosome-binding protein aMBF1 (putative translation factor)
MAQGSDRGKRERAAEALERLRGRLAGVEDDGWFFARIAEKVADRRKELGLSQAELAELVTTTQSAIARLESGGRPPRIDTLLRIANALDCELVIDLQARTKTRTKARKRGGK